MKPTTLRTASSLFPSRWRRSNYGEKSAMNDRPLWFAMITHKGQRVAELMGHDPKALKDLAHRYAIKEDYKRAVVQISPA